MKSSKFIAAAALALLGTTGTQAETYQGVHAPVSANRRTDVYAQAVVAAHRENPYAEGASSRAALRSDSSSDRFAVRAGAVAAARGANPYAEGYGQGVASVSLGTVDRATVRAQARAAARGQRLPL